MLDRSFRSLAINAFVLLPTDLVVFFASAVLQPIWKEEERLLSAAAVVLVCHSSGVVFYPPDKKSLQIYSDDKT